MVAQSQSASARRVVPEEEYAAWAVRFEAARGALADRALALDAAAEAVDRDLLLLGATAIEDKLQQARRGPPRPGRGRDWVVCFLVDAVRPGRAAAMTSLQSSGEC